MNNTNILNNMKLTFSKDQIIIFILIFYTVLFPRDMLNIKEILLFIAIILFLPSIISCFKNSKYSIVLILGIFVPVIEIFLSFTIGESTIKDALSNGYMWLFLLLIPIIIQRNLDIKTPFLVATNIIAFLIVSTWLLDLLGIISIYENFLINYFFDMGEIQSLSKGILAIFGYAIYYKSSILLIISLGYYINKKNYLRGLMFMIALFMTGARANAVLAIFVCIMLIFLREGFTLSKILIVFSVMIAIMLLLPSFIQKMEFVSALKYNYSEMVKISGITSTFELLNEHKYMYLFGEGLGSYFFDTARGGVVQLFELSFIDYFRQVGILGYIPFLYLIIKPIKYLFLNSKWLFISYISYLVIAATNPLLMNSTSFICYLLINTCAFEKQRHSLL